MENSENLKDDVENLKEDHKKNKKIICVFSDLNPMQRMLQDLFKRTVQNGKQGDISEGEIPIKQADIVNLNQSPLRVPEVEMACWEKYTDGIDETQPDLVLGKV